MLGHPKEAFHKARALLIKRHNAARQVGQQVLGSDVERSIGVGRQVCMGLVGWLRRARWAQAFLLAGAHWVQGIC